jgi:hypothetical protein
VAGKGRRFNFHGKFDSKREAMVKERETPNSFILYVNGYYYVVSPRKRDTNSRFRHGGTDGHESDER